MSLNQWYLYVQKTGTIQLKYAISYTTIKLKYAIKKITSRWRFSLEIAKVENRLAKYEKTNKPIITLIVIVLTGNWQ